MKKILISSFDMEVGGVERSLISLLNNFDYNLYTVDLLLCRHTGDFMDLIPPEVNLLKEITQYTTFRKSIKEVIKEKNYSLGLTRIYSKMKTYIYSKQNKVEEPGYYQMQIMWKHALPYLPEIEKEYDIAISYLWPHYLVAEKVKAKTKIAWIHTDYSTVETDRKEDYKIWNKFDYIVAVSDSCKEAFIKIHSTLASKVLVVENINSVNIIKAQAVESIDNPMLKDSRFKIITVARLSHAKGIDLAVEAFSILKSKGFKNIAWYIVGYGGDEDKVKKLITKHKLEDSFILLGKKINPYPYLKACDLYVQPSRYEGKAVTVLEAQILFKPVLITDYPTANSQVRNNYDGVICNLTIDGITEGIQKLYEDPKMREKLQDNCKLSNYSNSKEMDKIYNLFYKN